MSEPRTTPADDAHNDGGSSGPALAPVPRLALRPDEAAQALGIGRNTLWSLTAGGHLRAVKVGRCTLYPVDELRDFLQRRTAGKAPRQA